MRKFCNVDVKQDLKSNQSLVIPGGEEVEGYGGGGRDHMAFRGEQRENQSSPTVYKGGDYRKSTTS